MAVLFLSPPPSPPSQTYWHPTTPYPTQPHPPPPITPHPTTPHPTQSPPLSQQQSLRSVCPLIISDVSPTLTIYVCLSVCLSFCTSVCLSVCLSLCISVCRSPLFSRSISGRLRPAGVWRLQFQNFFFQGKLGVVIVAL